MTYMCRNYLVMGVLLVAAVATAGCLPCPGQHMGPRKLHRLTGNSDLWHPAADILVDSSERWAGEAGRSLLQPFGLHGRATWLSGPCISSEQASYRLVSWLQREVTLVKRNAFLYIFRFFLLTLIAIVVVRTCFCLGIPASRRASCCCATAACTFPE